MWICFYMLFHWFVLAIWFIKKSYNLIGWEHFGPYLINKNFPKYRICAGTWQIRNPAFGPFCVHFPNFLVQKKFFKKSSSVIHNFKRVSNTMPKLRKKILIQFQMPRQARWIDGRTDGRTDRPYFMGPFQLLLLFQLCACIWCKLWIQKNWVQFFI